MSDQRVFARYRANEIRLDLQNVDIKKFKSGTTKKKNALRKIIVNLTLGNYNEMIDLLPEILKFWQIEDDLEVRRICHEYTRSVGSMKPKLTDEILPFVLKDLRSKNENLQIMALRTLIFVPSPPFTSEAFKFLMSLINHRSDSIELTRTAIYSLVQMDDFDHARISGLLEILLDIVSQSSEEPTIQIAALNTIYAIHEKHQDMKPLGISIDTCFNLLSLLPNLNEWDKGLLLEALPASVVPQTHDDVFDMIDIVLPQLQHVNMLVVLNTLKFIVYLLNYVDRINETLVKRLSSSIVALLNKPPELEFLLLRNVILLLLSRQTPLLEFDVSYFFVEYYDPIYIKDTKLECLYLLANSENLPQILDELEQYATDIDIQMSRKAIRAIGNLAVKLDDNAATECVHILLHLLEFGVDYVVQEIISVLRNILRKYPNKFKSNIREIVEYTDSVQEPESKNAMLWIITQYSDILPNYMSIFQNLTSSLLEEPLEVQFSILNSSVKFFARSPSAETKNQCMGIIQLCINEIDNPDLRNRALMYDRLIAVSGNIGVTNPGISILQTIVDGKLPVIELNSKLDPMVLEELELNMSSITSVYLKPTSQIFRGNRTKLLPQSPILVTDREALKITNYKGLKNKGDSSTKGMPKRTATMSDYDKPAEKVNQLKGKRKSTLNGPSKLARKPSMLMRRLSMKNPF
ncbi:Apl1p NDAI_0I02070 [Naumovozyma dairenensis CBS 421]|uniref:AP complex subunit beta n=1 Tax=Naumovozyma dairenensis (strain ATCC 10597 / BCRC 20456 / CBS 421 / NBRC 0211 / NRRL Y-12639) TaxID=1071378 RepID=G0WG65_NAUDC|nr:hypothetical protein NDAI_0I02070 [Naumovozyma dairenensis CBS 421]CCD26776.1 hypothetical protein NDAI_0I02070 [Naumovozyma dairenensis CBS 421]